MFEYITKEIKYINESYFSSTPERHVECVAEKNYLLKEKTRKQKEKKKRKKKRKKKLIDGKPVDHGSFIENIHSIYNFYPSLMIQVLDSYVNQCTDQG